MQEDIKNYGVGRFDDLSHIMPSGMELPELIVEQFDGLSVIRVANRTSRESGVELKLFELANIKPGDRQTITGRIGEGAPPGSWGIALMSEDTETAQLAQHVIPKTIFALSTVLDTNMIRGTLMIQTTKWGASEPLMDFYIDNIIVLRKIKMDIQQADSRALIYSLENDPSVQFFNAEDTFFEGSVFLVRSGAPLIRVFRRGASNALHIGVRVKDWDGVDINIARMGLLQGNKYEIVVKGRFEGATATDSKVMLQGLPGYSWRDTQPITDDQEFTLSHVLGQAEVSKWSAVRVTTDENGATTPFYIYSIEVKRLGLL